MPEIMSINLHKILPYYVLHFHLGKSILEGTKFLFLSYFQVLFRKVLKPKRLLSLTCYILIVFFCFPIQLFLQFIFIFITFIKKQIKFDFQFWYTHLFLYVHVVLQYAKNLSDTVLCIVLSFIKKCCRSFCSKFLVHLTVPLDSKGKRDLDDVFVVQRHSVT